MLAQPGRRNRSLDRGLTLTGVDVLAGAASYAPWAGGVETSCKQGVLVVSEVIIDC
jgi:hypothetical protein